jgi:hypothetical protein
MVIKDPAEWYGAFCYHHVAYIEFRRGYMPPQKGKKRKGE